MEPLRARIVFLGMDSVYSVRVLSTLYQRGHEVVVALKPFGGTESRRRKILTRSTYFTGLASRTLGKLAPRVVTTDPEETDPFHIAGRQGTPCYLVGNASALKARELIEKAKPDFICIAFFNQLLRPGVLQIPRLATLNAHPSLLPAYRGPSPLFWMFHNGEREGGVTIHLVDPGEDSGQIVQREAVPIAFGETGPHYLDRLADVAARLMARAVDELLAGESHGVAQDEAQASRYARPTYEDLQVRFDRPAAEVFRMVRGLSAWAPLWAELGGERFRILEARSYEAEAELRGDYLQTGDLLAVRCQSGVVMLGVQTSPIAPR